ncbi:MAG: STN domain-containing protein, partial [Bacteroidota bacterium]|nr:STN domain-containing protein [Bacteroidota bacterium]
MKKIREPWVSNSYALKKCLTMMKWSLFFFFLSIIQVLAVDSYSQQTRLTLKFNQTSLESVLNEIENKSEFYFLYNQDFVNTKQNVDLDVKSAKIEDVLNSLLKGTDIKYTISDRQIVLT